MTSDANSKYASIQNTQIISNLQPRGIYCGFNPMNILVTPPSNCSWFHWKMHSTRWLLRYLSRIWCMGCGDSLPLHSIRNVIKRRSIPFKISSMFPLVKSRTVEHGNCLLWRTAWYVVKCHRAKLKFGPGALQVGRKGYLHLSFGLAFL